MKPLRTGMLLASAWLALAGAAQATPACSGSSRLMQWPSGSPVWEFCWLRPRDSSGSNGSGLEIHDVHYKGHLVLKRAHAPILNVIYESGGCGCFRDWSDQEVRFLSDNVLEDGYSEPTTPPQTVCDTGGGGGDVGSFEGVAAEKLADRLTLTTQFKAGWYRYTMKWTFLADGRIKPAFSFAAVDSSCISHAHTHHVYWRFDFDIDGAGLDRVRETRRPELPGPWVRQRARHPEVARTVGQPYRYWTVQDAVSGRGYRLEPGPEAALTPDAFAVADVWALRYHADEIDDSNLPPRDACAIQMSADVNGESVTGQDVVLWYRGGAFHAAADLDDCHTVGPELEPVGNWNP